MFCGEWKQRVAQLETERAEQLAVRRALDRSTAVVELSPEGVVLAANDNFSTVMGFAPEIGRASCRERV